MANDYYTVSGAPVTGSQGLSANIRAEFALLATGFGKLPVISGFPNKAVVVNGAGTALILTAGSMALAGNLTTTGVFNLTLALGASVTLTMPLVDGTLATLAGTETFTNKTITNPTVTTGTFATPAISNPAFSGTSTGSLTLTAATLPSPVVSGTITGTYTIGGTPTGSLISVLATGTTSARTLAARFAEITNVRDLGALGDGSTDDTAAFTAAIAIGGAIFIPAGTYIVDFTTVTTNCYFFGEGAASIVKKKNNSVGTTYSDGTGFLFDITNANITVDFEHFVMDGNYQGQVTTRAGATPGNTSATAIQNFVAGATVLAVGGAIKTINATAGASSDRLMVRVTNCEIKNCVTFGIYFAGTINIGSFAELTVMGTRFHSFSGGANVYSDGVAAIAGVVYPATGYSFGASGAGGVGIGVVDAGRVKVMGCSFIETRNPYAATLTANYDVNTYNLPMTAIFISTDDATLQGDPLDWSQVLIQGNYFQGCGRYEFVGNTTGVIDLYGRGGNMTISGNTFRNNWATAVRGKTSAKHVVISGNTIENDASLLSRALGISIGPPTHPSQQGNYIICNNTVAGTVDGILVTGSNTPLEDSDGTVADDLNDAQSSTASGSTTNAAGYAIGVRTVTMASAGTGTWVVGDQFYFAGDATVYTITSGDTDVSDGGTLSFYPALVVAIGAAAVAIVNYTRLKVSTASGATTNAAGYGLGVTAITLAAAGTGALTAGDLITFTGDTTPYMVTVGVANVAVGGAMTIAPGLAVAIPASATAIAVVTTLKSVNNISITGNVISNIRNVSITYAPLQTVFGNQGVGIFVNNASGVVVSNNIVDTTDLPTSGASGASEHGIWIKTSIKNLSVCGNIIRRSARTGITVTSHLGDLQAVNNVVENTQEQGMNIATFGRSTVVGNTVRNTRGTGILAGSSANFGILVSSNSVSNVFGNTASSVYGIHTGGATGCRSAIITSNIVEGVTNSGAGSGYGIGIQTTIGAATTSLVANNTVDTVDESGMFITSMTGTICNNHFKNLTVNASTAHGAFFFNGLAAAGAVQMYGNTAHAGAATGGALWPSTGGASYATLHAQTIAVGVVTVTVNEGTVLIDTEAAAATDDLDTINGLVDGSITTFRAVSSARDVVFKDGTGNMKLAGDFTLNNLEDTITLRNSNGTLYEMGRSDNGA